MQELGWGGGDLPQMELPSGRLSFTQLSSFQSLLLLIHKGNHKQYLLQFVESLWKTIPDSGMSAVVWTAYASPVLLRRFQLRDIVLQKTHQLRPKSDPLQPTHGFSSVKCSVESICHKVPRTRTSDRCTPLQMKSTLIC